MEDGEDADEFHVQWREQGFQQSRGRGYQTSRSAVAVDSRLPDDDPNVGLDPNGDAFNDMLDADFEDFVGEPEILNQKKRSLASLTNCYFEGPPYGRMEGRIPRPLSRRNASVGGTWGCLGGRGGRL
ncbi:hypothetical protein GALMADRAFT_209378 [Galerina marginata CBS 339.88]|uniref:Uncharacterized protein n=1 Tax=Galerina marginata (strain CBS 339.88) TaxID=685588 RepID=A0A067T7G9_GALM3|nr:hypothetical protein GALMADRAFT_209378 [Galerina marginata CBS 339.88]